MIERGWEGAEAVAVVAILDLEGESAGFHRRGEESVH